MTPYDVITDRIIEKLESGNIPWQKPWKFSGDCNSPRNIVTKRPYRGINVFILASSGFSSPYWMTYKQAQELGGNIRKGEKGTPVVFWKFGMDEDEETHEVRKSVLMRYYTVFNYDQTEGIKDPSPVVAIVKQFNPIEEAEKLFSAIPQRAELKHGGDRAYYSPSLDYVQMPKPEDFNSPAEYYSTLFHEYTHSTGHASRLNRKTITESSYFGSHNYSKEELVAEMGACFMNSESGILDNVFDNSTAYIQSWIKALKNDKTMVIYAAAQAQKAVDYMLNRKSEVKEEEAIAA